MTIIPFSSIIRTVRAKRENEGKMAHIIEILPELVTEAMHIIALLHECGILEQVETVVHAIRHAR